MSLFGFDDARRRKLFGRAPRGPVSRYLAVDWPKAQDNALISPLIALDLETSGLDPKTHEIISFGWTLIDRGRISLSSCRHLLVKPRAALPAASVTVHGIGDDRAASGHSLEHAMTEVLLALEGRILLGHHVRMDAAFLAASCRRLGWGEVAFPCICTLTLMEETLRRRNEPIASGSLTLGAVRRRFALPDYPTHDALWDALSAAEVWLALSTNLAGNSGHLDARRVARAWP